ncbi:MAG: class I SAM-dependent methyltransferase [Candidatus Hodarchaeales archaeon]|jgi:ubiquinone/menaquinone biosynthesis C-methylase UbiE
MNDNLGCFDWSASFYDTTRDLPSSLYQDISITLKENVPNQSKMKCLEIGVGTGRIAHCMAAAFTSEVYGVDISQLMLHQSLRNRSISKKLILIAADGYYLPFTTKFDLILTSHVLHQVKDHYLLVKSIIDSLSSTGIYIDLNAYVDHEQSLPFKIFYQRLLEDGYEHHFKNALIRKGLKAFFLQQGWSFREISLQHIYNTTMNTLVRFLKNRVFTHQRKIPDQLYESGLKHLYQELEARNIDLSLPLELPAYAHFLIFSPPTGLHEQHRTLKVY